jgi:predicted RNA-binding protein with PIN domain
MGIFDSIKSVFSRSSGGRETGRVYIVDAEKLADTREGRTGPVERFRAIQQLSRFAEREKIEMIAVVGGRPLREAAHGESYNGVRVFYVEENNSMADQMEKTLAQTRGRKPVVITNDKQLESRLRERGVETMRVTTLRKAFDGDSAVGGDGGRGRGDRDRQSRRSGRDRQPPTNEATGANAQMQPETPQDEAAPDEKQPRDTVDGYIDRVN